MRDCEAGPRRAPALPPYDEAVLDLVAQVPPGHATTYGDVAAALRQAGWGGGPRTVGAVMARYGSAVAWWRVVRADGRLPVCDAASAARAHRVEGTPLRGQGADLRVDLGAARVSRADLAAGAVSAGRESGPRGSVDG